jgi:hypothetical protein
MFMQLQRIACLILMIFIVFSTSLVAQVEKVKPVIFDGVVSIGYVNNGGYVNLSGPSLSITNNHSKFMLGLLPSMRLKKDKGTTKNAFVFPTLGFGLTYSYKFWSFQLPLFYNAKTSTSNGSWHLGFGVGYRINGLNKKV